MPNLTFVLPHWLYWSGLLLFPLFAMFMLRNSKPGDTQSKGVSLGIGYFLLATAGFIGMHRIYLRSVLGLLFIPLFIGLLWANSIGRDTRDGISLASNEIVKAEFLLERAQQDLEKGKQGAQQKIDTQQTALVDARQQLSEAQTNRIHWQRVVQGLALLILAGLLFDAFRIPALKRRCEQLDREDPIYTVGASAHVVTAEGGNVTGEDTVFSRFVGKLNHFCGSFVAYWSVIAVIVYYYEVLARYVFNSPTNWAHEGMFLMFGAQYLIAGGFCLRENAHVRVDVFYANFSERTKARVDIATSLLFFIFIISLLFSGWTFFMDSFQVREVSFTEWGIQYYPVKFSLVLGAALILLQGIARLLNDIHTLRTPHGT